MVNTDHAQLDTCQVPVKVPLGERRTRGFGAGGQPHIGAEAAEEVADVIAGICDQAPQVILVAALGGGTGTGAAPVIARIARQHGCQTVAVVTEPFSFEGKQRVQRAAMGLQALSGIDLLMTVPLGTSCVCGAIHLAAGSLPCGVNRGLDDGGAPTDAPDQTGIEGPGSGRCAGDAGDCWQNNVAGYHWRFVRRGTAQMERLGNT